MGSLVEWAGPAGNEKNVQNFQIVCVSEKGAHLLPLQESTDHVSGMDAFVIGLC